MSYPATGIGRDLQEWIARTALRALRALKKPHGGLKRDIMVCKGLDGDLDDLRRENLRWGRRTVDGVGEP